MQVGGQKIGDILQIGQQADSLGGGRNNPCLECDKGSSTACLVRPWPSSKQL